MPPKHDEQCRHGGARSCQSVVASNAHLPVNSTHHSLHSDKKMADWGPVVIATVLFVLLTPGLLFQLPGKGRIVEFANMQTSGPSIFVHTILYFALITIFLIAIGVHIYTG
ncbi:hypothetical protein Patl1_03051 [Pistacia atlantica]|uniref:Uncharacterized protein n=1 Tax=Pistacia atlantica TaxID=434234 RepID=A0ACC1CB94_9ROSI|nr:hypothetical protein Patl1_03051 [Pistacia atlantica]